MFVEGFPHTVLHLAHIHFLFSDPLLHLTVLLSLQLHLPLQLELSPLELLVTKPQLPDLFLLKQILLVKVNFSLGVFIVLDSLPVIAREHSDSSLPLDF